MATVNLSGFSVTKPKFRYSIKELVDDFLKGKLDKEVQDYAKNELGIDYVYKSYDFSKVDFNKGDFLEPDIGLNDLYFQAAKKSLSHLNSNDIGLFITINDYQQYLDPSPTVELIPKLSFKKNIRTQNFQGLACSSFSEALLNSAGYFLLNGKDRALLLIGTYYTPWFLDRIKQIKHISKNDKSNFYNLIYFLIFSDVTASVIISPKKTMDTQIQVNPMHILTLKDIEKTSKKPSIKISPDKKHRMIFDMKLQPQKLKENVARLSYENIKFLRKKFPDEFKKIKIWGLHTAGSRFVEHVVEKCHIEDFKVSLSYDLMKKTGNTGAVSSLQFLNECINKKCLSKNSFGCFVDYGWEGVNLFLFKKV
jgi:3-oxoacyl-[acyl-carrier-protein] synthase III